MQKRFKTKKFKIFKKLLGYEIRNSAFKLKNNHTIHRVLKSENQYSEKNWVKSIGYISLVVKLVIEFRKSMRSNSEEKES